MLATKCTLKATAVSNDIKIAYSRASRGGRGRGLYSPPIGQQSMQNTMFLALLRPIFVLKSKIAPSHWHSKVEIVYFDSELEVIWVTKKRFSAWMKTFFFLVSTLIWAEKPSQF